MRLPEKVISRMIGLLVERAWAFAKSCAENPIRPPSIDCQGELFQTVTIAGGRGSGQSEANNRQISQKRRFCHAARYEEYTGKIAPNPRKITKFLPYPDEQLLK